jgi:myo-inositol-1(or 4)-monophosphatase
MVYSKEKKVIPEIVRNAFTEVIKLDFEDGNITNFNKGKNDLVTNCDLNVEEYIIKQVKTYFPGDSFISEETNSNGEVGKRTWILDPIDGTVNFAHSIKLFGIQIALMIDKEPVFSAIYLPYFNEMYIAIKGEGAYLNESLIRVSRETELISSLVSYGDFSNRSNEIREKQIQVMNRIYNSVRKIKMFGAASVDFAFLASGKTNAHIMFTRNLWDIMPGFLLALEAGAVSNFNPKNPSEFIVVAANQQILNQLLEHIGEIEDLTWE